MAKPRISYICQSCGGESVTWSGRCPTCGEWNTLMEEIEDQAIGGRPKSASPPAELIEVKELSTILPKRLTTKMPEFDRVLGGDDQPGIIEGSVILLAGTPGVGKSTLLLQVASSVKGALYFSAEESTSQLQHRCYRLGLSKSNLRISSERRLPSIIAAIDQVKPKFVVIDSIQTIFDDSLPGTPGSLSQVRESCWRLMQFAKAKAVSILVVGHVTKDGVVAGPKTLEHLVDVVLYLEGEKQTGLRLLRVEKNRFGSTDEVGIWRLTDKGFETVEDPGKLFASLVDENIPGRALTITLEGTRPFLVEIQALVAKTAFGYPKRTAQGIDLGRLNILLAVLENRLNLPMSQFDVYVNVVGGFVLKDPAVDLAIAGAILSGVKKKALPTKIVLLGEIGLLGEIRPANNLSLRLKEVDRLNYRANQKLTTLAQLANIFDQD